jgi:dihydrofolate reductase
VNDTPASAAAPSTHGSVRRVALIAAVARNGVIGVDNRVPWRLPDDLKRFRTLTTGHTVIMGRKTWNSIGRPLPARQNIVLSRRPDWHAPGATLAYSLDQAIAMATLPDPVFVIGGEALYREALPIADLLYLTEIQRDFAGDARFPAFPRDAWREISREARHLDGAGGFAYDFAAYARAGV